MKKSDKLFSAIGRLAVLTVGAYFIFRIVQAALILWAFSSGHAP